MKATELYFKRLFVQHSQIKYCPEEKYSYFFMPHHIRILSCSIIILKTLYTHYSTKIIQPTTYIHIDINEKQANSQTIEAIHMR